MADSCSICTGDYEPLPVPCPECGSRSMESEFIRRERDASAREFMLDEQTARAERAEADRDRYREALRELVEAHSPFHPIKEQDRLVYNALDRARALLEEVDRGT